MPELPEVEHIRRGLDAFLPGRRIEQVTVLWPGVLATHTPEAFRKEVEGRVFGPVSRRGKYLLLSLPPYTLLVHLRMTGRVYVCEQPAEVWDVQPHVRAVFHLSGNGRLYFRDVRKFGRIYLVPRAEEIIGALGPEPLGEMMSLEQFTRALESHHRMLKPLLLDQHTLAGLGNIYVDESLWLARLHPQRRSDTLIPAEMEALYHALRTILSEAIRHGGTTMRDYRAADDSEGAHQFSLNVYGHAGRPCPRCGTPVERIVVGQRGTHLCPRCQPLPELREVCND